MTQPIRFILNDRDIETRLPAGMVMLDFIRKQRRLTGTKIGCREGDCGACTVLVGEWNDGAMVYRSMTSCLMPLGNAHGRHIVTIEGLNTDDLTPYQAAMVAEAGTQCGFCTVGFIVSFAGFCLGDAEPNRKNAIAAVDGNICRCTGYKSIERAAESISTQLTNRPEQNRLAWLVENGYLPTYFATLPQRLSALVAELAQPKQEATHQVVAGGTDLFVQRPEEMAETPLRLVFDHPEFNGITVQRNRCIIGASATAEDLRQSELMNRMFPHMQGYMKLVSSTPIRNMGTVGGNLVNASPIGDLTVFLLANDAHVTLENGDQLRVVPLRNFYKGYKTLDLQSGEHLRSISFAIPEKGTLFNFEKVSKRTHLDIASVNSAMRLDMNGETIREAHLSAGGVAPIPFFLAKTREVLVGQPITPELVHAAATTAAAEVSPISDARGTADYKRLLLRQLIYAHFSVVAPEQVELEAAR
ncbi:FAD binding domain-containing protein [Sulfidibacter corallicola]|uniref:FAD binding domain-containing protein n=1 Tax=Sulfidibacter corallicola TaxID=2818388 RepID=A0A8A4TST3_SULCO|nr:FAD binding domain-containing protein [Sulfidibacter corallicola]QTD52447.1 FAD binding domain-containing protein [Sulfidibacter corallicola]